MSSSTENRPLAWAIIASQFAPTFMFSGVAVALPSLGAELGAGATSLSLVETLFLAGGLSFLLPVGRIADAADKRSLYKLGLLGFTICSLLTGLLSSMPIILAIRFLQGLSSSVYAATGPAILAEIVPAEKRGRAYGASMGATYGGLTLGPVGAGLMIDAWGWRSVFFCGAALLFLGLVLIHWMMPSRWRTPERAVHVPSAVLVVASVLCLVGGSATLREGVLAPLAIAAGLALAVAFVLLQRHLERPLLDVRALAANRVLRGALLVQFLLYMIAFTSVFMLSLYMQVSLGHPARVSGQVIATGSVVMALLAPIAGRLADRYRARWIASAGVGAVALAALLATTLDAGSSLVLVAVLLGIQGVGFGLFSSPNMAIVMGSVPSSATGMASALSAKSRSLGMVFGMMVAALAISIDIGNDPIDRHPAVFIDTMHGAFVFLAVTTVSALVVSLVRRES